MKTLAVILTVVLCWSYQSINAQCHMMKTNHADAASHTSENSKNINNESLASTTFKVFGNCGMCKNRIEKALKADGIGKAQWDTETKMLEIKYDAKKISLAQIHQLIANAGHDTEIAKAKDETYNELPGCCQYEREVKKSDAEKKNSENHSH